MRRNVARLLVLAALAGLLVATVPSVASAHGPGTNGCTGVPQVGSGWDYHDECDLHDRCYTWHWYGEGWYIYFDRSVPTYDYQGRAACDRMFRDLMLQEARAKWPWWHPNRWSSETIAYAYYEGVRRFGRPFFESTNQWTRANTRMA